MPISYDFFCFKPYLTRIIVINITNSNTNKNHSIGFILSYKVPPVAPCDNNSKFQRNSPHIISPIN